MQIEEADLRAIVRLLGEIAALPGGIIRKKCQLLDGLCDLAGADEWRWALFAIQKDGSSARCVGFLRRQLHTAFVPPLSLPETMAPLAHREDLPPSAPSPHVILSCRSLDAHIESRIALYRDKKDPPYTPRESHLATVILDEIPWLHWLEWKPSSPAASKPLSPRQRLTLDLLLLGLGRKEIADQIGISPGTVVGYIRELYRHFDVNSQAELMRDHFKNSPIPKK